MGVPKNTDTVRQKAIPAAIPIHSKPLLSGAPIRRRSKAPGWRIPSSHPQPVHRTLRPAPCTAYRVHHTLFPAP